MNLNPEEQIKISEKLAAACGLVPECGTVLPAPVMYVDLNDFFKSVGENSLNTQKARETSDLGLTVITFAKIPRKPERHGGYWTYFYNLYVFRRAGAERLDETETPDEFRKKILKSYYDFVSAILGLHTQFEEETPLPEISDRVLECFARMENSDEFIAEDEPCRYIPGVSGFSADFPLEIKILFTEC